MKARILLVLSLVALPVLADEAVPVKDATEFAKAVDAVQGSVEAKMEHLLLAHQCAELASCAGACAKPLKDYSNSKADALAACPEFKGNAASAHDWVQARLTAYAARVRGVLPPAKLRAFDRECQALGIGGK
jgi:hypothetical protein